MFIYCNGCLRYVWVDDDDSDWFDCPTCGELIRRYKDGEEDEDDE